MYAINNIVGSYVIFSDVFCSINFVVIVCKSEIHLIFAPAKIRYKVKVYEKQKSFGLVLWHINHHRLFNAKSCSHILLYSLHNVLGFLHKYTSTRASDEVHQSAWHNHVWSHLRSGRIVSSQLDSQLPINWLPFNQLLASVTWIYMFFHQPLLSSPCLSFVSTYGENFISFSSSFQLFYFICHLFFYFLLFSFFFRLLSLHSFFSSSLFFFHL